MRAVNQIYFEISAEVKKLNKNVLWINEHYLRYHFNSKI